MKNTAVVLLIATSTLVSFLGFSEELPQVTYPMSEVRALHATANNKDYELFIQLPQSYKKTDKNYPLIVVNDSRFAFPITSGAMQLMGDRVVEEAIVVGIS